MKCFKCEKDMKCAFVDHKDEWEAPSGGVHLEGGWNFGSEIYDAVADGIHVELIVCDDCLKVAKGTDRMREMIKIYTPVKSVPAPTNHG